MTKNNNRLFLISGPCVIENYELLQIVCETLKKITEKLGIDFIFKASFDKANRSSIDSFRGPGLEEGLKMLQKIKQEFEVNFIGYSLCGYDSKCIGSFRYLTNSSFFS